MPERVLTAPEASLAYNTRLDVQAYQALLDSKLNSLNQLTRFNVKTSIGERLNVELFQTTYYIEENLIKHPFYKEPFIEIVKRGQKFRQEKGSTDIEREIAEVTGFEKIQAVLTDPDTNQAKVISISPRGASSSISSERSPAFKPGMKRILSEEERTTAFRPWDSIYQHNFFDVYEKNPDGTITMSRFTSILSWNEFHRAAQNLDPFNNICQNPSDADFLANPLITYKSIDQILDIMHPQEETMNRQEYQKLIEACTPLILNYLRTLAENPNEFLAEKNYNALLKFADVATGFDQQTIRRVATACGLSGNSRGGSFSFTSLFRPFSVVEFGLLQNSCTDCGGPENHFHCPGCKGEIASGLGITTCPHCGLTKEQAGSNCG